MRRCSGRSLSSFEPIGKEKGLSRIVGFDPAQGLPARGPVAIQCRATIPHPWFLADHSRLAMPGTSVQGHRARIQEMGASFFGRGEFASDRRRALLPGQLRGLKHAYR